LALLGQPTRTASSVFWTGAADTLVRHFIMGKRFFRLGVRESNRAASV
jgi:hypothetical protein